MKPRVLIADASQLLDEDLFTAVYGMVPDYRREKTDIMRFPADKRLSLAAGALLSLALKEQGIDENSLTLLTGEYQKPFFSGLSGFHFNLSHSGQMAICSVAEYENGCDIELVKPHQESIAERFFHPCERDRVLSASIELRADEFCRIWTLKESWLKFTGKGINIQLDSFGILFDENDRPYLPGSGAGFYEFRGAAGYRCACCMPAEAGEPEFINIDLKKQVC